VSQYLIRDVIYAGPQDLDEVVFRVLLFKVFNRIETWGLLTGSCHPYPVSPQCWLLPSVDWPLKFQRAATRVEAR
jgi:hypothetical protein